MSELIEAAVENACAYLEADAEIWERMARTAHIPEYALAAAELRRDAAARLQSLSTTPGDERATLAKIVSEHGHIMVSPMGEGLGWRPFGLEGWTAFPSEHPPSSGVKELVEALAKTQWMLEAIVHLRSTNFAEVQERILANRSALSRVQLPSVLMDNVDVKG